MRHNDVSFVEARRGENRTSHPLYKTYNNMKNRCTNSTSKDYKNYGGRGIVVCSRWRGVDGFANFVNDMGERPTGHTLDRKDVNGNYEPSNCKWSTRHDQASNTRSNNDVVGVCKHGNGWLAYIKVNKKLIQRKFRLKEDAIAHRAKLNIEILGRR